MKWAFSLNYKPNQGWKKNCEEREKTHKNEQIVAYRILLEKEFARVKTEVGKKDKKSFQFKTVAKNGDDRVQQKVDPWRKRPKIAQMNDDANRFMCSFYSRTSE